MCRPPLRVRLAHGLEVEAEAGVGVEGEQPAALGHKLAARAHPVHPLHRILGASVGLDLSRPGPDRAGGNARGLRKSVENVSGGIELHWSRGGVRNEHAVDELVPGDRPIAARLSPEPVGQERRVLHAGARIQSPLAVVAQAVAASHDVQQIEHLG